MTIEVPAELEMALKVQANARGVSPDIYVRQLLARELESSEFTESLAPFESGRGMWTKYGIAPLSAEEIDANRAEMFKNFGEHF